jgi:hypothetical protein
MLQIWKIGYLHVSVHHITCNTCPKTVIFSVSGYQIRAEKGFTLQSKQDLHRVVHHSILTGSHINTSNPATDSKLWSRDFLFRRSVSILML